MYTACSAIETRTSGSPANCADEPLALLERGAGARAESGVGKPMTAWPEQHAHARRRRRTRPTTSSKKYMSANVVVPRSEHLGDGEARAQRDVLGRGELLLRRPDELLEPRQQRHVVAQAAVEGHRRVSVAVDEARHHDAAGDSSAAAQRQASSRCGPTSTSRAAGHGDGRNRAAPAARRSSAGRSRRGRGDRRAGTSCAETTARKLARARRICVAECRERGRIANRAYRDAAVEDEEGAARAAQPPGGNSPLARGVAVRVDQQREREVQPPGEERVTLDRAARHGDDIAAGRAQTRHRVAQRGEFRRGQRRPVARVRVDEDRASPEQASRSETTPPWWARRTSSGTALPTAGVSLTRGLYPRGPTLRPPQQGVPQTQRRGQRDRADPRELEHPVHPCAEHLGIEHVLEVVERDRAQHDEGDGEPHAEDEQAVLTPAPPRRPPRSTPRGRRTRSGTRSSRRAGPPPAGRTSPVRAPRRGRPR